MKREGYELFVSVGTSETAIFEYLVLFKKKGNKLVHIYFAIFAEIMKTIFCSERTPILASYYRRRYIWRQQFKRFCHNISTETFIFLILLDALMKYNNFPVV